jgi:hypothetical protein
MKKNVLFWIAVNNTHPHMQEKHGGFEYFDFSRKSWEYWCKKNDVIFFPYETTGAVDSYAHKPTWQRWFDVFPQIEDKGIDYDKICVIDSSAIVRWDAPNFFDLCPDGKVSAFKSHENLRWITESADGYESLMQESHDQPHFKFDLKKYINCGFQIFDKSHKNFLEELEQFYYDYYDIIMRLQNEEVKRGTDQPIYNYLLQMNKVDVNINLPADMMLMHLNRFDWFSDSEDDDTPFFIKYGYIWFYSGFAQSERYNLMKQTWDSIKENYK